MTIRIRSNFRGGKLLREKEGQEVVAREDILRVGIFNVEPH